MKSSLSILVATATTLLGLAAASPSPIRLGLAYAHQPDVAGSHHPSKRAGPRLGLAYAPSTATTAKRFERRRRGSVDSSGGFTDVSLQQRSGHAAIVSLSRRQRPDSELDAHPALYHQQHVNHAQRRYARALGVQEPNFDEQVDRMRKRAESVGWELVHHAARDVHVQKRSLQPRAGFSAQEASQLESDGTTKGGQTTANQSLALTIEANDVGYFAAIQIGSPAQTFNMVLDTGSADMWVPSQSCRDSTGQGSCSHATLGTKTSSTFKALSDQPFQVTYGTGQVQGVLAQDDVDIAGLKLTGHTFGVTTAESDEFANRNIPFDGLMGLAKSTLSNQKQPTPIESLSTAGLVDSAQMGFTLGRSSAAKNNGEATFGGIDQSKINGQMTVFDNVNPQGFWEGAVDTITMDGKDLNLAGRTAILDTGTSLIIAPPEDAAAIHAAIPGAKPSPNNDGTFTLPCTTTSSLALSFAGRSFAVQPADLAFAPVDPNDLQGDCSSGVMAGQIGGATQWLVGDVFLKNVYFATSVKDNKVGLATLKHNDA